MSDSSPVPIPTPKSPLAHGGMSPKSPKAHMYLIPSPLPTRRTRTYSASERAMSGPTSHGSVQAFCREKGHGFIKPSGGGEPLFVHISDIEGEFVPKPGDDVSYKATSIPPKNEKMQAVHVRIVNPAEGVKHERWDTPLSSSPGTPGS